MKHRVVITGMGVVAPNAVGLDDFLEAIQKGKSRERNAKPRKKHVKEKTKQIQQK